MLKCCPNRFPTGHDPHGCPEISQGTVDRHMSNIFNKLGVSSHVEATTLAIKHHIVDVEI